MQSLIDELVKIKNDLQAIDAEADALQTLLDKDPLWIDYQDKLLKKAFLLGEAGMLKDKIREKAVKEYNSTGNKHVHQFVNIRIMTKLHYEEEVAKEYCFNNLPAALKLDGKIFEKYCKAVGAPAFVTVAELPQATIAQEIER